jgi:hypothetical protein
MKYKEYITSLAKRLFKKRQIVRDPQIMHPDREWAIGLLVAAIIFSVSGYFSIHTYLSNRSATAESVEDDKAQTVYRESIVQEALEMVNKRERSLQNLTKSVVVEESIEEVATTTEESVDTVEPTDEVSASTTTPNPEE